MKIFLSFVVLFLTASESRAAIRSCVFIPIWGKSALTLALAHEEGEPATSLFCTFFRRLTPGTWEYSCGQNMYLVWYSNHTGNLYEGQQGRFVTECQERN